MNHLKNRCNNSEGSQMVCLCLSLPSIPVCSIIILLSFLFLALSRYTLIWGSNSAQLIIIHPYDACLCVLQREKRTIKLFELLQCTFLKKILNVTIVRRTAHEKSHKMNDKKAK